MWFSYPKAPLKRPSSRRAHDRCAAGWVYGYTPSVNLTESELIHLLAAILALLLSSAVLGGIFQRFRQPRVIGEILGGVLFGPTVLGAIAPGVFGVLFAGPGSHRQILAFVFWLGLLLLMFCSGLENQSVSSRSEWRLVLWLVALGTLMPLVAGAVLAASVDFSAYFGPRATAVSFGLILANAIAVTSIPVISKILMDTGRSGTPFARVVLTTAMIEDMALWILLSLTLALAAGGPANPWELARGIVVTIAYFACCQQFGHRLYDAIGRARWNPFKTAASGMPLLLVFLLTVLIAYLIGVNPIFGAFLAGRILARSERIRPETKEQVRGFSFALFIPVYFASVGLKLDLRQGFDVLGFAALFVFASMVKAVSVFTGARLGGRAHRESLDLAMALNARGGPGIVLATVAMDAGLITTGGYAILVLLSLSTSQLAGWWLQRRPGDSQRTEAGVARS